MFRWLTNRPPASVKDVMSGTPMTPSQPTQNNFAGQLAVPAGSYRGGAPFVTRVPRQAMRFLYSYGKQSRNWFPMIATGQVESTKFQPYNGVLFDATFNESLYLGVYPQNTGISFKVDTLPKELKRGQGPQMNAQPRQYNSIFTRRAYNGAPSIPAKPAAS